jgi:hypothetical protein
MNQLEFFSLQHTCMWLILFKGKYMTCINVNHLNCYECYWS